MANEKRLIDANALDEKLEILKVRFKAQGRNTVAEDYNFVQTVLLAAPTVDAVEVVRCGECIHQRTVDGFYACVKFMDSPMRIITNPRNFCSAGRRRENHGTE